VDDDEIPNDATWKVAKEIANAVMIGAFAPVTSATHYYNPSLCSPKWAVEMKLVDRFGQHVFLK
jgi:spore germination cell wall hydrolase CwlJ-like protein